MDDPALEHNGSFQHRVSAVRRFSRFYTRIIGVLHEGLLRSRFTLTEARILYELFQHPGVTATELGRELGLDPGYLSRILQRFEQDGLLAREQLAADRRQSALALTQDGRKAFAPLDTRSRGQVGAMLIALSEPEQVSLVSAMGRIEALLDQPRSASQPVPELAPWRLRGPRPGDIGWVVARHGALYAEEYGFDHRFEALVAQVAGDFLAGHDAVRERCWIAEHDGANVGSVFLVRQSDEAAKLRLLIVEPAVRGLGIGRGLVEACIGFARAAGYRRVTLWTNEALVAARAIYQHAGFRLTASVAHRHFGPPMIGEDWELELH